jgi:AcrR family transcriptional regulator
MPVLVDRAKTRDQIAELAAGIVAREGLHALTMRRLATEAGTSRAIVSTYFADMRDLVLATFQWVSARQVQRIEAAEAAGLGLEGCVEALLPLDHERLADWRVTIAFLGYAVADAELAAIERHRIDGAVERFTHVLMKQGSSAKPTATDRREAKRIVSALLGVAIDHSFDPSAHAQPRLSRVMVGRVLARDTDASRR